MSNLIYKYDTPHYANIFKNIGIIFLLYFFIFQPPLFSSLSFSRAVYLTIEIIVFMAVYIHNPGYTKNFIKQFKVEIRFLVVICAYSVLRDLVSMELVYADRFLTFSFQAFFFSYLIIFLFHKNEVKNKGTKENKNIFNIIYWTCLLAAIFSTLLLLIPSFDSFYESISYDSYYETYAGFEQRYRAYGISENLSFTYAYIMGLFCGYSLLLLRKNVFFVIPFILFLLGVIYNARIGFVAVLLFILYFLFIRLNFKALLQTITIGFLSYLSIIVFFPKLMETLTGNFNWVLSGFYEVSDFVFGTKYQERNTLETLTSDFIIFPDSLGEWIVGRGISLFTEKGMNSDVGYILQLNYGGIVLLLLILSFMIYMCWRFYHYFGLKHWYTMFFMFSLLILNFKGFIYASTPGGRLLFFLYIYFLYKRFNNTAKYKN